jgi:predicted nuclease of predicted toxin-antitoxin system
VRILIDESLPRALKQILSEHEIFTVQEMGWTGIKNGELLAKAESNFKVLLTADKNLRYQQDLRGLKLAVIVFPSNRLNVVRSLEERVKETLSSIKASEIIEL